ncbi:MAG TPA: arsenate reductase ArsC [Gemmatimonadales bacterium]|nr:arsenate reductase ArsC [Gemmatimonadales bacterium]
MCCSCTGNSARGPMAEAILNHKGRGRFRPERAGSQPAASVNPLAIETLKEHGIPWDGHSPRSVDGLERESWDFVITVCDRAKESCPVFPGQPILAHWGQPDPTDRRAFRDAFRRIDLLLALPIERLERAALAARVRAIPIA